MVKTWTKKQEKYLNEQQKYYDDLFDKLLTRITNGESTTTERLVLQKEHTDKTAEEIRKDFDEYKKSAGDDLQRIKDEIFNTKQEVQKQFAKADEKLLDGLASWLILQEAKKEQKKLLNDIEEARKKDNYFKVSEYTKRLEQVNKNIDSYRAIYNRFYNVLKGITTFVFDTEKGKEITDFLNDTQSAESE